MDGGNVAGLVLFLVVVLVDLAGLGRGLAVDGGGVGAVGLGDGGGHGGGVAKLDGLVVHLVGGGQGQHGEDSDEGLQDENGFCLRFTDLLLSVKIPLTVGFVSCVFRVPLLHQP